MLFRSGLPRLAVVLDLNFTETIDDGLAPFIVGDLLKLYLAAMLLPGAWKLVKRLRG